MANRYWVGGTAAWDATAGTKWALTSGAAGGQAIPTSADDVFFDAASGANTVTISTGNTGAKSITCTGFTGTLAGTAAISVAGSITLVSGMTYSYTGTLTITATSTITSAGKTFGAITVNAAAATITLADALTLSATSAFTLTAGTLALANFTLTTGTFSSTNSNVRAISFGSGNIALASTTAGATVLSMGIASNFTWTGTGGFTRNMAATATVLFGTIGGSTTAAPNLTVNAGASALTITSGSYFKNVDFTGSTSTVTASGLNMGGNLTLATGGTYTAVVPTFLESGTVTSNLKSIGNTTVSGGGITVTLADAMTLSTINSFTLTQGTINLAGFTLSTGVFSSSTTTTRAIAFGSTGKIQLTGATTATIWTTSTPTNFSFTGTSRVEVIGAGSGVTKTITTGAMSQSQALSWVIDDSSSATTNTITFSASSVVRDLTANATNGGRYQISNSVLTIYGNYTYGGTYTSGKTSVFFNGTTDTIRNLTTASTALDLSTGDWTVEAWIYKTVSQQGVILALPNVSSGSNSGFSFQTTAADAITQNNGVTATVNAGTISLNTWTHVAVVRTSGNTQLYVGGVAVGSTFTQAPNASQYFSIGCNITATFAFFPGYISNLRMVKGLAVYSGNFSPPSLAPLATSGAASASAYSSTTNVNTSFASSATSILACQTAMDFVENSGYKFPIAASGTPTVNFLNPYSAPVFPLIAAGTGAWTFSSTGTQTITTAGLTHDMPITFNAVSGSSAIQDALNVGITRTTTLTNGTLNLNNFTLSTGLFSSSNANTRVIAFGTTGKIQLKGSATGTNWTTSTTTGFSYTGTSNIESFAGGAVTKTITCGALTEAQSLSFTLLDVAGTITFSNSSAVRNLTLNGAFTLTNSNITIYGNYTYTTATALTSVGAAWTFGATGARSITFGAVTHDFPITFSGVGGSWTLQSAATVGSTYTTTLENGTLDLNGYTFTTGAAYVGLLAGTGARNITFNGGTLAVVSSGASAFGADPTGFTTTAGTGTGTITLTSASAKTFAGGGSTFNCTLNQGGAGALTISGSNTFNNITNTTQPATVTFTASTTQTVSNFGLSGTSGNLITINSSTAGTQATLSKTTGTINAQYLSIQDSSATGGATWNALTSNGNVNAGNNSGWIFGTVSATGNFFLLF